jgi:hypothetical protein
LEVEDRASKLPRLPVFGWRLPAASQVCDRLDLHCRDNWRLPPQDENLLCAADDVGGPDVESDNWMPLLGKGDLADIAERKKTVL